MRKLAYYEGVCDEIMGLLKQERERRGLSNYAVSQNSGVSEITLSRIERRMHNPSIEMLLRIADGIGVNLGPIIMKAQKLAEKKSGPAKKTR